jgi:integral membrane protein
LSPKKLFNTFARAEAVTWTLLITALVLRGVGFDTVAVTIAGGIHGAVFLSYAVTAGLTGVNQRWGLGKTAVAVALAIVPFATVPFEMRQNKNGSLEGSWRTAASEDPRDVGLLDKLFRWFIARPLTLIAVIVIGLTILFVVLVSLGSPTTWFD